MLFAEDHARILLVAHTIFAAALVASTTHLVVWMRGFPRGRFQRINAVRKFAVISAVLFVATFVLGNVIYPVYKVRVRVEYLEQPGAVVRDYQARLDTRRQVEALYRTQPAGDDDAHAVPEPPEAAELLHETARVARWFDVKEHWVALGMAMSVGCALVLLAWNPKRHSRAIGSIAFLMALSAAFAVWLGAIVGVIVTSYRAIGGIG